MDHSWFPLITSDIVDDDSWFAPVASTIARSNDPPHYMAGLPVVDLYWSGFDAQSFVLWYPWKNYPARLQLYSQLEPCIAIITDRRRLNFDYWVIGLKVDESLLRSWTNSNRHHSGSTIIEFIMITSLPPTKRKDLKLLVRRAEVDSCPESKPRSSPAVVKAPLCAEG